EGLRAHPARVRAGVAGLDPLAVGGAAVVGRGVAVVAGLVAGELLVAADDGRLAQLAGRGAVVERLLGAGAGAAIGGDVVAVVALLAGIQVAVAAVGVAHAGHARHRALPARLARAGR